MTFMGKEAQDPAGLRTHCAVSDLASLIEQGKAERRDRGDLNQAELDYAYRTTIDNEMRANQERRR